MKFQIEEFRLKIQTFRLKIQTFTLKIQTFTLKMQPFTLKMQPFTSRMQPFTSRMQPFTSRMRTFRPKRPQAGLTAQSLGLKLRAAVGFAAAVAALLVIGTTVPRAQDSEATRRQAFDRFST